MAEDKKNPELKDEGFVDEQKDEIKKTPIINLGDGGGKAKASMSDEGVILDDGSDLEEESEVGEEEEKRSLGTRILDGAAKFIAENPMKIRFAAAAASTALGVVVPGVGGIIGGALLGGISEGIVESAQVRHERNLERKSSIRRSQKEKGEGKELEDGPEIPRALSAERGATAHASEPNIHTHHAEDVGHDKGHNPELTFAEEADKKGHGPRDNSETFVAQQLKAREAAAAAQESGGANR